MMLASLFHRARPLASWLAAGTIAMWIIVPTALHAQHVRVTLADSATGTPLRGAIVSLERDGAAERIAPVLSDELGRALVAAPEPGSYRVRVERVGSPTWRSHTLALAAGDTAEISALVRLDVALLDAAVIVGTSVCGGDGSGDAGPVLAVWEEARKGVLAARLADGHGAPALRIRRFERLLNQRGEVETDSADTIVASTVRPFRVLRTPAELSREGYVMKEGADELFLAPDAAVLLSDEFVEDHCLSLTDERRGEDLVGVVFRPAPGRRVADIAGTFWLDREGGQPRMLDYEYVNVDRLSRQARAGGTLAFQQLPTGHWVVSAWSVRTPRRGITRSWLPGGTVSERETLFGAREEGAELLAVATRQVATGHGPARVSGTIFDSLAGRPLAGVHLRMLGSPAEGVTDSLGHYLLQLPRSGVYTMELSHPRLSLYRVPLRQEVETRTGELHSLDVAIPPMPELMSRLCPGPPPDDAPRGSVAIVGRALWNAGDLPAPDAALRLTWRQQVRLPGVIEARFREETVAREVTADGDGYFLICHVPPDVSLDLVAEGPDGERAEQRVRSRPNRVEEVVLRLPASP